METSGRGTLFPDRLPEFHRVAPAPPAASLVRWFWISRWDLPPGVVSRQELIAFPAFNLVVESSFVGLSGPATRASFRDLDGRGWGIGALLRPAAVPAFTDDPALWRDRYEPVQAPGLLRAVRVAMAEPTEQGRREACAAFADWLRDRVGEPGAEALQANRLVEVVESSGVLRVGELAARLGVSERTVQRLARRYVGVSPAALIRRRRLQEAAERLRSDPDADLAAVASTLGYVDQAHLTNDFARVVGVTPGSYRRSAGNGRGGGRRR